jgi:hypothetical protein
MKKSGSWTQEEIDFLKNNIEKMGTGGISTKLGRSRYAVYMKARALGVYIKENEKKEKYD